MGTTATQIENHIDDKRQDLSSNLQELETRVKSMADWRYQFEHRTWLFLGLAFGGGVALAAFAGTSSKNPRRSGNYAEAANTSFGASSMSGSSPAGDQILMAWENIKGALIGLAADRLKDYADQIIPGFSHHYQQAQATQRRSA